MFSLFTACNQKDPPEISLQGKWTLDNIVNKEFLGGTLSGTTTIPGNGATIDFQNNGNVVLKKPGSPDETHPYTLKPDSKVEFDGDTYEIRDLTQSRVTLYIRDDYGAGDYDEIYANLKR